MNTCKIVEDLLPLYVEELTSRETAEFVEAHLQSCGRCAEVHRRMCAPMKAETMAPDYKKSLRKGLWDWTWRIVLGLVLAIGLPLYFFWEIGAFGDRTVLRSEVSGKEFVVVDTSKAGFFNRGGAYVMTPDGKGRNLKGNTGFEGLQISWAPNGTSYFARWDFGSYDESYYWGDESVMEPDEAGNISFSYEDRKWPGEWDFTARMSNFVCTHEAFEGCDLGKIEYEFDMWSLDSERMYFLFTTENGYGGRVKFDCTTKEFTLQKS